jgi:VWFA-related protein
MRGSSIASFAVLAAVAASFGLFGAVGSRPLSPSDTSAQETNSPHNPIRVTTKLISLSVTVHDKHGQPVTDLTKNDFVLLDGKKPQTIEVFSLVKTGVTSAAEQTLAADTYSNAIGTIADAPANLTIVLLDSLNTSFFDRSFPQSQIKRLLLTLQPQDRVALYALGPRLRVLHDFTSDSAALIAALKTNTDVRLLDVDVPTSEQTNTHNLQMVPLAEESVANQSAQLAQNRANVTAAALRAIADHVSYLPGRKNLIWISDDFPIYIESNNLQRTPDGKKLAFATDDEMVMRALDNAHVAVYPIDARGLVSGGIDEIANESPDKKTEDMSRDANMEMLARRTGGRAYLNTNGIAASIRQTIDGSSATYELAFYPQDVVWDGSFHKLQVKVNRRDVQVQARDGYFALAEPNLSPKLVRELISQAARSQMEATGIRFSVHVASASPHDDNKLNLSFTLDPSQFAFKVQNDELQDALDIAFVTLDANDHVVQKTFLALPFKLDAQTYAQLVKAGLPLAKELIIPRNAAELRVIVYDEGNSRIGSVRVPLASTQSKKSN